MSEEFVIELSDEDIKILEGMPIEQIWLGGKKKRKKRKPRKPLVELKEPSEIELEFPTPVKRKKRKLSPKIVFEKPKKRKPRKPLVELKESSEIELEFSTPVKRKKRKPSPKIVFEKPKKRKPRKPLVKLPPLKEVEFELPILEIEEPVMPCYDPEFDICEEDYCDAETGKCRSKPRKDDYRLKIGKRSIIVGKQDTLKRLNRLFGKDKGKILKPLRKVTLRPEGFLEEVPKRKKVEPIFIDIEEKLEKLPTPPKEEKKKVEEFIKKAMKERPKKEEILIKKKEEPKVIEKRISDKALKEYALLEATIKKCLGITA